MSWILGGIYCLAIWLVFAKLKLMKLTLPIAIVAAALGPLLIVALLFCAQYFHPFTSNARVFHEFVKIAPQLKQAGRVVEILVEPNKPVKQGDVLFRVDPTPYSNTIKSLETTLEQAKQGKLVADASVKLAEATITRTSSNLDFATKDRDRTSKLAETNSVSQQDLDVSLNRYAEADAASTQAAASLIQAKLSVDSAIAQIQQVETQLADAKYDLEQTTVVAPGNGYVTNLQLQRGTLVGGAGGDGVMSFVLEPSERNQGVVVATFDQKNFLRIKPGMYAEVAMFGYPGEILTGRVVSTIDISGDGQLAASGTLPNTISGGKPTEFAVRIKLDRGDELRIPGGSQAEVAVYTEDIQVAGIPVMFLIRAKSWIRFLL